MDLQSVVEQAADSLSLRGWFVADRVMPEDLSAALLEDAQSLFEEGSFRQARVGSGEQLQVHSRVRSDVTHWLNGDNPAQAQFIALIDALRQALNRSLFLGLQRQECHYALYRPGTFYRRHLDNFNGASPRMLTFIYYLNPLWQPQQGGALRLYTDAQQAQADVLPRQASQPDYQDILPEMGRLVLFMSQVFPHEVLETARDRWSITGWLRNDSADPILDAIDPVFS